MNYQKLGRTELSVSEMGMGCWGIGSTAYGRIDDRTSKQTLEYSYKLGINFFDTADIYGDGQSERLVGQVFKDMRHDVILATKVGSLPHSGKVMPVALDAEHINQAVEESLDRLQTDYIDLYQLHSPPTVMVADAVGILQKLKDAGKIRYIGVSVKSPSDACIAIEDSRVDSIQLNYNMIDQRARELWILDSCSVAGKGVIARTPLAFGFLSGRYKPGVKFVSPDHRANWSQAQIDKWAGAPELFKQVYMNNGCTPTQLALGFCISDDRISTTIPGMMTPIEVIENTATQHLTHSERSIIRYIYESNTFFTNG